MNKTKEEEIRKEAKKEFACWILAILGFAMMLIIVPYGLGIICNNPPMEMGIGMLWLEGFVGLLIITAVILIIVLIVSGIKGLYNYMWNNSFECALETYEKEHGRRK